MKKETGFEISKLLKNFFEINAGSKLDLFLVGEREREREREKERQKQKG